MQCYVYIDGLPEAHKASRKLIKRIAAKYSVRPFGQNAIVVSTKETWRDIKDGMRPLIEIATSRYDDSDGGPILPPRTPDWFFTGYPLKEALFNAE